MEEGFTRERQPKQIQDTAIYNTNEIQKDPAISSDLQYSRKPSDQEPELPSIENNEKYDEKEPPVGEPNEKESPVGESNEKESPVGEPNEKEPPVGESNEKESPDENDYHEKESPDGEPNEKESPDENDYDEKESPVGESNENDYDENESPVGESNENNYDEKESPVGESNENNYDENESPVGESNENDYDENESPVGESNENDYDDNESSSDDNDSILGEVDQNDSTYLFQQAPYYVITEEALQTDFSSIDSTAEYQVHICAYHVHLDSREPYLTYYLVANQAKEYTFPTYTFGLSNVHQPLSPRTVQHQTGGNDEWHQFEAEFKDHLLDTLTQIHCFDFVERQSESSQPQVQASSNTLLDKIFKGFIIREPEQTHPYELLKLFVVVDTSHIPLKKGMENQVMSNVHATPYEILCSQSIRNRKVAKNVANFFQQIANEENSLDFHHVQRIDKTYVESPYVLYLCKNSSATDVYSEEESAKHWFPPRIKDSVFGEILLFSLNDENTREDAQRYAVFAKEKNTVFSETEFTSDQLLSIGPEISCFCFQKNRHQYMVVNASMIVDKILA
jgi:hypothetical protein